MLFLLFKYMKKHRRVILIILLAAAIIIAIRLAGPSANEQEFHGTFINNAEVNLLSNVIFLPSAKTANLFCIEALQK